MENRRRNPLRVPNFLQSRAVASLWFYVVTSTTSTSGAHSYARFSFAHRAKMRNIRLKGNLTDPRVTLKALSSRSAYLKK
ncbi:hypothetical protein BDV26DRAFT_256589 [Aspergillus bertholletiae]|uniref:Uncharacterized protein n=1 Tax=Aspergillus bertholletiae TaxID=1226010 RepID=A0A5N7BG99_9EURO|nr:hypothetical protein BDV26DRAFT_256589 [Aspergillus bertholletiae]